MNLLRRVRKQFALWRELLSLRSRTRFARGVHVRGSPRGTVCIVNFSDWSPRVVMDGIIATALRLRGYDTVILTNRTYTWAERTYRALGVNRFIYFDEMLAGIPMMSAADVEIFLREHASFVALHRFSDDDIAIGRHVLSTVVRQLKVGSLAFGDPKVTEMLRRFIPLSLQASHAAKTLFERHPFDAMLFFEKGYTPYAEILDRAIAKGLCVIQYHHGHRSDLLIMKRYTQKNRYDHSFSLSEKSWNIVRSMDWPRREEDAFMGNLKRSYEEGTWFNRKFLLEGKKLKSPEEARAQLGLDPAKKTAVIFSHVLWDATFFFGENLFPDYEQWLVATVRAACENPNVNWIIKLHPDYVWKMKQMGDSAAPRDVIALQANIGTLPPHIKVVPPETDISTYSFFAFTDYCITVRGTIGIEAPCFGIPVFTAGTGRYSGLGFTNDSKTPEEYLEKMRRIQEFPKLMSEEITLARRHAYALFHLRPLPFTSCEIRAKPGTFEQESVVRVHSREELERAVDLERLVDWVLDSKEEDYLRF